MKVDKLPIILCRVCREWAELAYDLAEKVGDHELAKQIAIKILEEHRSNGAARITSLDRKIEAKAGKEKKAE